MRLVVFLAAAVCLASGAKSPCHGTTGHQHACCKSYISTTAVIGKSWGNMPEPQQQRWKRNRCDQYKPFLLAAKRAVADAERRAVAGAAAEAAAADRAAAKAASRSASGSHRGVRRGRAADDDTESMVKSLETEDAALASKSSTLEKQLQKELNFDVDEDGGAEDAADAAPAAVRKKLCTCHSCVDGARNHNAVQCGGKSTSCSEDDAGGCFGLKGGIDGSCACAAGTFSHGATHRLGGTVTGLAAGQTVQLSSASPDFKLAGTTEVHDGERVARQSVNVGFDGAFWFGRALAAGQGWVVSVTRSPAKQVCVVTAGATGAARHGHSGAFSGVRVACHDRSAGEALPAAATFAQSMSSDEGTVLIAGPVRFGADGAAGRVVPCPPLPGQQQVVGKGGETEDFTFVAGQGLVRRTGGGRRRLVGAYMSGHQRGLTPKDCVQGAWTPWTSCNDSCGECCKTRGRDNLSPATNGGKACAHTQEMESCPEDKCNGGNGGNGGDGVLASPAAKVDCVVSQWSAWTECSKPCGQGSQSRHREVLTPATDGGKGCPYSNTDSTCNDHDCGGNDAACDQLVAMAAGGEWSLTGWVRTDVAGGAGAILSYLPADLTWGGSSSTKGRASTVFVGADGELLFAVARGGVASSAPRGSTLAASGTPALNDRNWHHFAVVQAVGARGGGGGGGGGDGTPKISIYIDGAHATSEELDTGSDDGLSVLMLGNPGGRGSRGLRVPISFGGVNAAIGPRLRGLPGAVAQLSYWGSALGAARLLDMASPVPEELVDFASPSGGAITSVGGAAPTPAPRKACECKRCDGGGDVAFGAYCAGRSIGCSVGSPKGCYGAKLLSAQAGAGAGAGAGAAGGLSSMLAMEAAAASAEEPVSGRCSCATGRFSYPETLSLGGTLRGLASGAELVLSASSHSWAGERAADGDAVQTVLVATNGPFAFPFKLSPGQPYKVSVATDPPGQVCFVGNARRPGGMGARRAKKGKNHGIATVSVTDLTVSCRARTSPPAAAAAAAAAAATATAAAGAGACHCMTCNGAGPMKSGMAMRCSGMSIGCTLGDPSSCYGLRASDSVSGECDCTNGLGGLAGGSFKHPEIYSLGGTVGGLAPGARLTLSTSSSSQLGQAAPTEGSATEATQTTTVAQSGPFRFPLKFASGQTYHVQVLKDPAGQRCSVSRGGTIGFVYGDTASVRVTCANAPTPAPPAAPTPAPASEAGVAYGSAAWKAGCDCVPCSGGSEGAVLTDLYCSGRSTGCSVGYSDGCYGVRRGDGVGGKCFCKTHEFSRPETNSLGGRVVGLLPGTSVDLAASTRSQRGAHAAHGDAVQRVDVKHLVDDPGAEAGSDRFYVAYDDVTGAGSQRGMFAFQYRLAAGQNYQVQVLKDPVGQRCTVDPTGATGSVGAAGGGGGGGGGAAGGAGPVADVVRVTCTTTATTATAASDVHAVPPDTIDASAPPDMHNLPVSCSAFGCSCQGISDKYATAHGHGWGTATAVARSYWLRHRCKTSPQQCALWDCDCATLQKRYGLGGGFESSADVPDDARHFWRTVGCAARLAKAGAGGGAGGEGGCKLWHCTCQGFSDLYGTVQGTGTGGTTEPETWGRAPPRDWDWWHNAACTTAPGQSKPGVFAVAHHQQLGGGGGGGGGRVRGSAPDCAVWRCSCQGFADLYETQHGVGWGTAPRSAQPWWLSHRCQAVPKQCGQWGCACQGMSDLYGVVHDKSWGKLDAKYDTPHAALARLWWVSHGCQTEPREMARTPISRDCDPWQCACQGLSNKYSVVHGRSWGTAPHVARRWWERSACTTSPDGGEQAASAMAGVVSVSAARAKRAALARFKAGAGTHWRAAGSAQQQQQQQQQQQRQQQQRAPRSHAFHTYQRPESEEQKEKSDASKLIVPCFLVLAIGGYSVYSQVQANRVERQGYSSVPGGHGSANAYAKPDDGNAESVTEQL